MKSNDKRWKGGVNIASNGYITINVNLLTKNERTFFEPMFFGKSFSPIIYEHRFLVAKKLKRVLMKDEEVHHLNGIKTDNRIENLILMDSRQHKVFIPLLQNKILKLENNIKTLKGVLSNRQFLFGC